MNDRRGFSLLEMMVSLAIVGILIAMGGSAYEGFATMAKINLAKATMGDISVVIQSLRLTYNPEKTLMQITGNSCSVCSGPAAEAHAWQLLGFDTPPLDPFGMQYHIDENELEFGPTDCRFDALYSGGPDKVFEGQGAGDQVWGDDIVVRVPMLYGRGCLADPQNGGGGP